MFPNSNIRSGLLATLVAGFLTADVALAQDSDGDGLSDADETGIHLTDPDDPDTDADELFDGFEVTWSFDPLDPDEDTNGTIDGRDDADGDGLGNAAEMRAGTGPTNPDTDGDGLSDGDEFATGNFATTQVLLPQVNRNPGSLVAADLDGDGDVDVLEGTVFGQTIAWSENTNGGGAFAPPQIFGNLDRRVNSLFAADLDGDGDLDVLSASGYVGATGNEISWFENTDGLGSFGPQQVISTDLVYPQSVFGADLDGDGDMDVLSSSNLDDEIAWFENTNGLGIFGPKQTINTFIGAPRSVIAADVDGDGDMDILSASGSGYELAWNENTDGGGTFGPSQLISNFANAKDIVAADVDGDGDLDLVSAQLSHPDLVWYENTNGAGAFGPAQLIDPSAHAPNAVSVGDLDGDGDLDVLSAGGGSDVLSWHPNSDGAGTFGGRQVLSDEIDHFVAPVAAADFDGDGDLDVLSIKAGSPGAGWWERISAADPFDTDTDNDGLLDGPEVHTHGSDPRDPDSDGDGLDDGDEVSIHGTLPADPDTDADGLSDGLEVLTHGTDPLDADSDDDGLPDGWEVDSNFDPLVPGEEALDPDLDGLSNADEFAWGADPLDPDTDGDSLPDGWEVTHGYDPAVAAGESVADPDGDFLVNRDEQAWGSDPFDPDSDADGYWDGQEDTHGSDPTDPAAVPSGVSRPNVLLNLAGGSLADGTVSFDLGGDTYSDTESFEWKGTLLATLVTTNHPNHGRIVSSLEIHGGKFGMADGIETPTWEIQQVQGPFVPTDWTFTGAEMEGIFAEGMVFASGAGPGRASLVFPQAIFAINKGVFCSEAAIPGSPQCVYFASYNKLVFDFVAPAPIDISDGAGGALDVLLQIPVSNSTAVIQDTLAGDVYGDPVRFTIDGSYFFSGTTFAVVPNVTFMLVPGLPPSALLALVVLLLGVGVRRA